MNDRGAKSRVLGAVALAALGLVVVAIVYLARSGRPLTLRADKAAVQAPRAPAEPAPEIPAAQEAGAPNIATQLAEFCERLRGGSVDAAALATLRRELLSAEPRATIAAIRAFLDTGEDSATGQRLAIAAGGGELEGAPTFRVWLLDVLGVIDRTAHTGEAAAVSRGILSVKTSADEWALALRNVAWGEPQAAPFLAAKFREMITWEPWLAAPSAGLLEAFDAAVFVRDPALLPLLGELVAGNRRELQRAAAMSLDRLAEADPLVVMNYLNAHPGTFAQRPLLRADYFAKADLSQAPQRGALEMYLARGDVSLAEKTKLINALAAPASFVGDTLFTAAVPPADDTERFAALERAIRDWTARFPQLAPTLTQLQQRLRER